jgi:outer membrane receptor protein involved in Fe transport
MFKSFVFLASLLLFTSSLQSQTVSDTDVTDSTRLAEIVVSASRKPADAFRISEAIGLLKSGDWEQQQDRSTPEILFGAPGIFLQKTNHGGGSPFMRGLTGNQTLLMIDGVRLSNATFRYGPNQYFNTIDPFSLDRIETLRGSGSVQYGSDALGGVIQAFSKDPVFSDKTSLHGRVLGRAATQGMETTGRAELAFSGKKWAILAGATGRDFGDLVGGKNTGRQTPSGYEEAAFDLKTKLQLPGNILLTVAHQYFRQHNVPVYHKVRLEDFALNEMDPQERQLTYARAERNMYGKYLQKMSLLVSRQTTVEGRNSQKNGSTTLRHEQDKVASYGLNLQSDWQLQSKWNMSLGAEAYSDLVNSIREDKNTNTGVVTPKRGLYPDDARFSFVGLFLLQDYTWRKWQVNAGLRFNTYQIKVKDEAVGTAEITPSALVWNIGLSRFLSKTDHLFIAANSGFRAPNVDDLGTLGIVDFRYEQPNFNLKPEHSQQIQLGWKHRSKRWQSELYVFRLDLRDLIARTRVGSDSIQGYPLYQKENVEVTYVQGIEANFAYTITPALEVSGQVTYAYGQNETKNEPMRRIPPVNGRLALQYTQAHWKFSAECLAAGKQDRLAKGDTEDNRIPKGGTPGWQVLNLHGSWNAKRVSFRASLLNLGNADYRTHGSGINGVGRSVWFTAVFHW